MTLLYLLEPFDKKADKILKRIKIKYFIWSQDLYSLQRGCLLVMFLKIDKVLKSIFEINE